MLKKGHHSKGEKPKYSQLSLISRSTWDSIVIFCLWTSERSTGLFKKYLIMKWKISEEMLTHLKANHREIRMYVQA